MKVTKLVFIIGHVLLIIQSGLAQQIQWQSGGWAFACDFKNNDLTDARIPGDQCGGRCASTQSCTHFTWTTYNGGTCWMKSGSVSQSNAFFTGDNSMVCGIVGSIIAPTTLSQNSNSILNNVLTTYHGAKESGSCRLPSESYAYTNPVALGNINSLQYIKFQGNLCGHVLQIDCGKGKLYITVTNSNLGGGLDLYASSWNKATNYLSPGQQYCSVQLTSLNSLNSNSPKCYHATTETQNLYYRSVGLLNTGGKIVTKAVYKGINGVNNGGDFYYTFNGYGTKSDQVTFFFQDGTTYSVPLSNCLDNSNYQIWS